MREALVRHAIPQKSWPIVAIRITIFAAHGSSEEEKIDSDEPRPWLVTKPTLVAANVIASRTSQPIAPAQKTERQTPFAAPTAAPFVSSLMCAEAS